MSPALAAALSVDATVVLDVADGVPNFARASKDVCVKAVVEYLAPAAVSEVQSTRDANREAFHRARKGESILRFDDQMDVVRLNPAWRRRIQPFSTLWIGSWSLPMSQSYLAPLTRPFRTRPGPAPLDVRGFKQWVPQTEPTECGWGNARARASRAPISD